MSEALYEKVAAAMPAVMRRFYDRLFDDVMIGFFFLGKDKERLIAQQQLFMNRLMGAATPYRGPSMPEVHRPLDIFEGQFWRRHTILSEVLAETDLSEELREAWLALDRGLLDKVVRPGPCRRGDEGASS